MITLLLSLALLIQNPQLPKNNGATACNIQKKESPIKYETKQKVDSLKANLKFIKEKIKQRKLKSKK
jgi:hypothetical protein